MISSILAVSTIYRFLLYSEWVEDMVRLTADLIWKSPHFFNAIKERELDLRGNKIAVIENLGATEVHNLIFFPSFLFPLIFERIYRYDSVFICASFIKKFILVFLNLQWIFLQDQFDTIDLSDNEIVKLENVPYLNRLGTMLINNNRITRINPNIGGTV